jgi:hypothetical protein
MQDPKKTHVKKEYPKCRVNGCTKKGIFENGICPRCKGKISQSQKPKKTIKQVSNNSYPKALKEAKRAFQLLRRVQESDHNGVCKCVHGSYRHYTKCDGGHLFPAYYLAICFNPINVNPQEKDKNKDMMNPETTQEYVNWFIDKYGKDQYERLKLLKNSKIKYSTFELVEMTKIWTTQIEKLKTEKGLK